MGKKIEGGTVKPDRGVGLGVGLSLQLAHLLLQHGTETEMESVDSGKEALLNLQDCVHQGHARLHLVEIRNPSHALNHALNHVLNHALNHQWIKRQKIQKKHPRRKLMMKKKTKTKRKIKNPIFLL